MFPVLPVGFLSDSGPPHPLPGPDLANIGVWWESDRGVTLDGAYIVQINDRSGNGYDWAQPHAQHSSFCPTIAAGGGKGGKDSAYFAGSQQFLQGAVGWDATGLAGGMEMFLVVKGDIAPTADTNFGPFDFANDLGGRGCWDYMNGNAYQSFGIGARYDWAEPSCESWVVLNMSLDPGLEPNKWNLRAWTNGTSRLSLSNVGATQSWHASRAFCVGRSFSGSPLYFKGHLPGLITYTAPCSDLARAKTLAYLMDRWVP